MTIKATKKPVTIEAVKWDGENIEEIIAFCGDSAFTAIESKMDQTETEELYIKTLEGNHHASVGDYIIKGVNGEFYPCKPDIFEKTYDIHDTACDNKCELKHIDFVETTHDLLTTKYTKVYEEANFNYNAPHRFQVVAKESQEVLSCIHFQEGPIKECGVNGVCNEDLLVMVVRRLEGFQNSEFKCRENSCAITKLEEALLWLRKRTMGRENRGVEGTHTV